ncbi:MAG TPA: hypothetical protein VLC09_02210 [Polyangiaceae bacterium]|nr:hypothetical protein [Polyangiaceae bacterium]
MKLERFGELTATVVAPDAEGTDGLVVVLLHGYGAPGTDLVGLADHLDVAADTRFVFPRGPLVFEPAYPDESGRAWWQLDMVELQMIRLSGRHEELTARRPEGLDEARAALGSLLDSIQERFGISSSRIVLGGFSQGAMLATDFVLRDERPLAGLVVLSGSLIAEAEWLQLLPGRRGLPVFQSHSPDDAVLPFAVASRLHGEFERAGLAARFVSFRGGHGIGPSVLAELAQFLRALSG